MPTRIISYNVNGIRAAFRKGFEDWLEAEAFDVVGIQETKALEEQVDLTRLRAMGYHIYWHAAEKKGYSGVAVFTKIKPQKVSIGMGIERFDQEGRVLRLDFDGWTLINAYFPSGTSGEERQNVKFDFLQAFNTWTAELRKTQPNLIIQGDYNIAHTEMDIHNPKGKQKTSGFLPEERQWMTDWWAQDFVDSFRQRHPNTEKYSWWSYRANSRARNKGWRIDYQAVSTSIANKITGSDLLNDVVHSDHCPCLLEMNI